MRSDTIVDGYLKKKSWRRNENSNATPSFGALNKHITSAVSKDYWLRHVYPESIAQAYLEGDIHIHDLGGLSVYCCGYSLRKVIQEGVHGIDNIPTSDPAKHLGAILSQLANITTVYQNEIMGAVAFSSMDTFLAPYIKEDNLTYKDVRQAVQNFIYAVNSNSRGGAEPAFLNITMDLTPPKDLIDNHVMMAGGELDYTYRECQDEMNLFNKVFCELMIEGDAKGKPFAYPIPTYNIHDRFDWDNENNDLLFEMAGKFGYPYFANFLNSDMKPEDARSMCCRLRISLRELEKRNGGLFGAGESTGSIGVVTLGMPRFGYLADTKEQLFRLITDAMEVSKESLEIKREFLQKNILDTNLIPAFNTYVGTLNNHFSTIGMIGLNEMCENFLGKSILEEESAALCLEILDLMRDKLSDFQEETGNLYNLEATPAESTSYRMAKNDLARYPDTAFQGTPEAPYYTNSCHAPVSTDWTIMEMAEHQEPLQIKYTGGTVMHIYLDGPISGSKAKHIIRTLCELFSLPYISLSPINRVCPFHGYVEEVVSECPTCGEDLILSQRITGYLREIKNFNIGKKAEFSDRFQQDSGSC